MNRNNWRIIDQKLLQSTEVFENAQMFLSLLWKLIIFYLINQNFLVCDKRILYDDHISTCTRCLGIFKDSKCELLKSECNFSILKNYYYYYHFKCSSSSLKASQKYVLKIPEHSICIINDALKTNKE